MWPEIIFNDFYVPAFTQNPNSSETSLQLYEKRVYIGPPIAWQRLYSSVSRSLCSDGSIRYISVVVIYVCLQPSELNSVLNFIKKNVVLSLERYGIILYSIGLIFELTQ
jgi:hypothetical protein